MKEFIKQNFKLNRRLRRKLNRKSGITPNLNKDGFRPQKIEKSLKLLREFWKEGNDPNGHEGQFLMKNIKNMSDTISFPDDLRRICKNLLNQEDLYNFLDLEEIKWNWNNDDMICHKNKNEEPIKLLQFGNVLLNTLEKHFETEFTLDNRPFCYGSHNGSCDLSNGGHRNFCLKTYKNISVFRSDVVDFEISWIKDGIEFSQFLVKDRFNGTGTKFLEILKDVSEITNIPVYLFPIDYKSVFNGGTIGLKEWYSKNGIPQVGNLPVHCYEPHLDSSIELSQPPSDYVEHTRFLETEFYTKEETINDTLERMLSEGVELPKEVLEQLEKVEV